MDKGNRYGGTEMRILLFTQYYWPENFLINSLVPLLTARGIKVTVLTGKPNYPDGQIYEGYDAWGMHREKHDEVPIYRLPILPRGHRSRIRLALNYASFIIAGWLLGGRLVNDCEYDLILVYAPSPLLQALPAIKLARNRQVPLAVWVQDLWPESLSATGHVKNRWMLAMVGRLVRRIYRACDRILVQSRAFIPPVAALTDNPDKIRYYPNFYQAGHEPGASARARESAEALKAHFSVVFAGNLGSAQALDTIVDAARQLLPDSHIRIVLVGSGSLDDWLAKQRDAHGLTNLILAGRFDATDMPAIFASAEALLVTLKAEPVFGLTVPSKVQAYLAAGRPILAALDGEGAQIVRESGAGLCCAAGDARALADNVRRLAAMSADERLQMGRNGRHYFENHFAPETLADTLVEHLKELTARKEKRK
jgi:glycosyltransferase involved in cell wall biosynthesis